MGASHSSPCLARDDGPTMAYKELLVQVKPLDLFQQEYEFIANSKPIGKGATGVVCLATSKKRHGEVVAVKSVNRTKLASHMSEMKSELAALRSLDHPNVIRLIEMYEDRREMRLVLEYCSGGNLANTSFNRGEQYARRIIYQVTRALAHMHFRGIVHRDLKAENVVFVKPSSDHIKVIDFGFAVHLERLKLSKNAAVGTAMYIAPELLLSKPQIDVTGTTDIWALGVLTHMLLFEKKAPFVGESRNELFKNIRISRMNTTTEKWATVSPEARDFCNSCLKLNPADRPSADALLHHKFLSTATPIIDRQVGQDIVDAFLKVAKYGNIKKTAIQFLCHQHFNAELADTFDDFFVAMDKDNTGTLVLFELEAIIKTYARVPMTDEEIAKLFVDLDQDRTGRITHREFLTAVFEMKLQVTEQFCKEAFIYLDHNKNGFIDFSDIEYILGATHTTDVLIGYFKEAGFPQGKAAQIDWEAFKGVMMG